MKKSQLRKIIRESIKELMTEQNPNFTQGVNVKSTMCDGSSYFYNICIAGNPQVGDVYNLNGPAISPNHPLDGKDFFVVHVTGQSCWASVAYPHSPSSATCGTCCAFKPDSNDPGGWGSQYTSTWTSGACWADCCSQGLVPQSGATAGTWPVGGLTGTPYPGCPGTNPTSGCDPSAWPNHANWTTSWPQSGPFNNQTNPLQPCNHICGKITDFQNDLATNPSPVQTNVLECKLEEAMNQYGIHNCAQVNSNNCPI
jgi:hypothetical protein